MITPLFASATEISLFEGLLLIIAVLLIGITAGILLKISTLIKLLQKSPIAFTSEALKEKTDTSPTALLAQCEIHLKKIVDLQEINPATTHSPRSGNNPLMVGINDDIGSENLVTVLYQLIQTNAQLKDNFVLEIKQILSELTEKQINASGRGSYALAEHIKTTFKETLKEPLNQIANVFEEIKIDQKEPIDNLNNTIQQLSENIQITLNKLHSVQQLDIEEQLRTASQLLTMTQQQMHEFLTQIMVVIEQSHTEFSRGMSKSLTSAQYEFQQSVESILTTLHSNINKFNTAIEQAKDAETI